jgi:hypothetical protein
MEQVWTQSGLGGDGLEPWVSGKGSDKYEGPVGSVAPVMSCLLGVTWGAPPPKCPMIFNPCRLDLDSIWIRTA